MSQPNHNNVFFDDSAKEQILNAFDKTVDKDGYIIEKSDPKRRVIDKTTQEEVKLENFVGVRKGSLIFVTNEIDSLIQAADAIGD